MLLLLKKEGLYTLDKRFFNHPVYGENVTENDRCFEEKQTIMEEKKVIRDCIEPN